MGHSSWNRKVTCVATVGLIILNTYECDMIALWQPTKPWWIETRQSSLNTGLCRVQVHKLLIIAIWTSKLSRGTLFWSTRLANLSILIHLSSTVRSVITQQSVSQRLPPTTLKKPSKGRYWITLSYLWWIIDQKYCQSQQDLQSTKDWAQWSNPSSSVLL
jgi:hypothetical protein